MFVQRRRDPVRWAGRSNPIHRLPTTLPWPLLLQGVSSCSYQRAQKWRGWVESILELSWDLQAAVAHGANAALSVAMANTASFFRRCFTSTETIRTIRDGETRTATSTFTQLLSSVNTTSAGEIGCFIVKGLGLDRTGLPADDREIWPEGEVKVVEPVIFGFPGSTLIPQRSLSQDLGQTYIYIHQKAKKESRFLFRFILLFALFCLRRRRDTDYRYKTVQFKAFDKKFFHAFR